MKRRKVAALKSLAKRIPWLWMLRDHWLLRPFTKRLRKHLNVRIRGAEERLESLLWGGFPTYALEKLEGHKRAGASRQTVARSAWALARMYAAKGDRTRALENIDIVRANGKPGKLPPVDLLELALARRSPTTKRSGLREVQGKTGDVAMLLGALAPDAEQLPLINKAFSGYVPLKIRDAAEPVTLGNITADTPRSVKGPRVSVIMPAYNAEDMIGTAMASVLRQSWEDLELIVVDRGSADETWNIVTAAAQDTRIIPLQLSAAAGENAARNFALEHASGELVTVCRAEEWSHPEKIATQAGAFARLPVPNLTAKCAVLDDLTPVMDYERVEVVSRNASSLMLPARDLKQLGGWDEADIGADEELIARLETKLNADIKTISPATPLTLSRVADAGVSFSRSYGRLREYHEAGAYWRSIAPSLSIERGKQPFPAPRAHLAEPRRFQVLFISDLSLPGGTTSSNLALFKAAHAAGITYGLYHLPRPDKHGSDINPKIRKYMHEGNIVLVTPDETVVADLVIVNHPPVLMTVPDQFARIETGACIVLANQAPMTHSREGMQAYAVADVLRNGERMFGVGALFAPISPLIRNLLAAELLTSQMTPVDWFPLLDCAEWGLGAGARPHDHTELPTIGRHSRDAPDKWLSDPNELRAAYLAGSDVRVRILGGADHPRQRLGTIPRNWEVLPFGAEDVRSFLESLDFYVYFPDEYMIEAFGRAAMEAMASGIPTILPARFKETFGDAAIYAEPHEVAGIVAKLWKEHALYKEQSERGIDFVLRNCDSRVFAERVRPYLRLRKNQQNAGPVEHAAP